MTGKITIYKKWAFADIFFLVNEQRDLANSIRISPLLFIAFGGGGFKKDIISHAFYYARLFYSKDPVFSLLFILIQFISVGLKQIHHVRFQPMFIVCSFGQTSEFNCTSGLWHLCHPLPCRNHFTTMRGTLNKSVWLLCIQAPSCYWCQMDHLWPMSLEVKNLILMYVSV